ncbi:hypothetical protein CLIB1444_01S06942 [[Candida] jaroonii]|uniref:Uncharacterized protein n=1 Tax=[Candida] jaroonii TaxID=467808 RepID=A0ACA9Y0N4_9ASCO|nr:hypothetical protein CLIB1444_01S06942 [[Candida] jaroonii]
MEVSNDNHHHIQLKETVLVGKTLVAFTSVFVTQGVLLFGYDQGVMSSLLTNGYFQSYFNNPSPVEIGTMIAILEIGALFSSFAAGKIGDSIGRRATIRWGALIFVIGGSMQTFSFNIVSLSIGRLIAGVAVGLLTTIIPCYQSEISPPDDRGFFACLEFTGNILGYASSIWIDYGCSYIESNWSWRSPLLIQVIIGFLLFLGSFIIVETPRWLLDKNHDLEGMIVISDLYANGDVEDEKAKEEYRQIKEDILISRIEGGERSYHYLITRYTKRLSVACFSQMFAQLNGINIVSYYAPMIFESAGWIGRQAIFMTGINAIIYILSTLPPWWLVDGWGRKPLLLSGAVFMCIPLTIIAFSLYANNEYTANTVVVCVFVFNAAFGMSWGPIPWMMNEVLPNSVRSKGAALSTATNWFFNFVVGEMTPILLDVIRWKTYLIPAVSCVLSFFCVYLLFPETKGLTLEDMGSVFDDSSSIFSFHSSGNVGYGSTDERRASISVDGTSDIFHQSAASIARNPNLMKPDFDGIITGTPPPPVPTNPSNLHVPHPPLNRAGSGNNLNNNLKPIKSDVSSSSASIDGLNPVDSNVPPQEIEPPTFDEIYKYKVNQMLEPNVITKAWFSLVGRTKKSDEEAPFIH